MCGDQIGAVTHVTHLAVTPRLLSVNGVHHSMAPEVDGQSSWKEAQVTYIVNESCIKCKYMDCVEVCPVDCFYEGENMLVIHPDECIDCGVCEPECPVVMRSSLTHRAQPRKVALRD